MASFFVPQCTRALKFFLLRIVRFNNSRTFQNSESVLCCYCAYGIV